MDLYSRQLYALGKESLISMKSAKVLILGSQTPFVEIMKNLILMGVGEITIADNRTINMNDLDENYYIHVNDIKKDFVDIVGFRMQKLNPTIKINKYTKNDFTNKFLKSFTFVILLNNDKNFSQKLHELEVPHILTLTSGFYGLIFVDLIKFVSLNPNGEKIKQGLILNYSLLNEDVIIETVDSHDLFVNNYIRIKNEEYQIKKIISTKKFILDRKINLNLVQLEKYEEIKKPKEFYFKSINNFTNKFTNNLVDSNGFVFINSIIGGIVAQNVINYINKSGTPINQFLSYDYSEFKPLLDGRKFNEKVTNKKIFIVGSGALGCEHIKNLAFIGVKNIVITDFDKIEKSNLSRQFLFRDKDIQKFKSIRVKKAIQKMKNNINIESLTLKVSKETENIFNDKFYDSLDCVFNALDNIEARKYVDSKCIDFDLPLFESGTLGTKANSQTIIPLLTESYSNSVNNDDSSIPICTIKSFPYLPEHSVAWAKDLFYELFSQDLDEVKDLDFEKVYQEKIIDNINSLTQKYPKDYIEDNNKFWTNTRRFPILSNLDSTTLKKDFINLGTQIKNRITQTGIIEKFDKDSNLSHVEFLTILTNIRNLIYSIETIDEFVVKGIAGKIIPALCTTTSVISGLVIVEFLRYCLHSGEVNKLDFYSNNYINLSLNLIINSTPIKDINNEWKKVDLRNLTLEDIIIKIQNEFDYYISLIYIDDVSVYSSDVDYDLSYLKSKLNTSNCKVFGYIILDNDSNDIIRFYL